MTRMRAAMVLLLFFAVALLQAWPLPLHLSTHLTGPPSGDTGVYVWNTWVFRHELIDNRTWPLWTNAIFAGDEPANLGHHNYTLFANLLAVPLQTVVGVVTSFNLIYLVNVALAGFGMFLLARRVTAYDAEAILAGVLFACSGFMVGRSLGHFSLVAAAPLPFFVWCLLRCWEWRRTRDAVALGLVAAWSVVADPYYAVYCLMLATGFLCDRALVVSRTHAAPRWSLALTIGAALATVPIVLKLVTGGGVVQLGSFEISVRSLYTPVLILTVMIVLRALVRMRLFWSSEPWPRWTTAAWLGALAILSAAVLASPVLLAQTGGDVMDAAPVLWRSGPQGADLLALVLPHPAHPLIPASIVGRLATHPGGLIEQSASLSMVALVVIGLAWWNTSWRPSRRALVAAAVFGLMTLGPFIYVAGINTYVPTPWTILRYVPLTGDARMPSRMAIVATMAVAMLFASALNAWTTRLPKRRTVFLLAVAALLWIDLWPAPRALVAAGVPAFYNRIAQDVRPVSVLTLPTGVRDGLSSLGDFTAHSQFYQTVHGKRIIGGYLSRTTPRRREAFSRHPVLGPLSALSGDLPISEDLRTAAREAAAEFVRNVDLGYVVINHRETSAELERFAVEVLKLQRVEGDANLSLYVPVFPNGAGRAAGPEPRPYGRQ